MDYKQLGQEAYETYFRRIDDDNHQSSVLEDVILAIARREELNPNQVARVCQFVNTKVFLKLFKTLNDKTFEFSVANPEVITEKLVRLPLSSSEPLANTVPNETQPEPEPELEPEMEEIAPSVDFQELMRLKKRLEDRLDSATMGLVEQRPRLVQHLASRIHQYNPETVIIAVKTVGGPEELLKAACQRAGSDYDSVQITLNPDDYVVDDRDALLQKVSSYGKMMAEKQICEQSLEKVATVEKLAKANLLSKGMNIAYGAGELKSSALKSAQAKQTILSNTPTQNKFTVTNPPRLMPEGNKGYVRS